jgi:hypothetical protein
MPNTMRKMLSNIKSFVYFLLIHEETNSTTDHLEFPIFFVLSLTVVKAPAPLRYAGLRTGASGSTTALRHL